jgi:cell division septal protein FtsQ
VKIRYIIIVVFAISFVGLIFYFLPRTITINEISCNNQYGSCSKLYVEAIQGVVGNDLLGTKKEIKNILDNEVLVDNYYIQYQFPDELEVTLIERKPLFGVSFENDTKIYLIDKNANVLSNVENTTLPVVEVQESTDISEKVDSRILFSLTLLYDVNKLFQINEATLEKDGLYIRFPEGHEAIFPDNGDTKVLIGSLRLIYQQLNTDEQNSRIEKAGETYLIDLRYKNPVIHKL